jgi:hypothetical protein
MVTLIVHTLHVFQRLDVMYFKTFETIFFFKNFVMAKKNYFELNKVTLTTWVDKAL